MFLLKMKTIILDNDLSIKKLDQNNKSDIWLANELDKDELICGKNGYLWSIKDTLKKANNILNDEIYATPYSIYNKNEPIGYIEISPIIEELKLVNISYALLKRARGKGDMTRILTKTSEKILNDLNHNIEIISLLIDSNNIASQKVASSSGFTRDTKLGIEIEGCINYTKRRF